MSEYSVKLSDPSIGDEDLEVLHLGRFKNNATHEVTEEQVDYWEANTGQDWPSDGVLEVPRKLESTYEEMTVAQLQGELERRGLPKSGNKDELIARLTEPADLSDDNEGE